MQESGTGVAWCFHMEYLEIGSCARSGLQLSRFHMFNDMIDMEFSMLIDVRVGRLIASPRCFELVPQWRDRTALA